MRNSLVRDQNEHKGNEKINVQVNTSASKKQARCSGRGKCVLNEY